MLMRDWEPRLVNNVASCLGYKYVLSMVPMFKQWAVTWTLLTSLPVRTGDPLTRATPCSEDPPPPDPRHDTPHLSSSSNPFSKSDEVLSRRRVDVFWLAGTSPFWILPFAEDLYAFDGLYCLRCAAVFKRGNNVPSSIGLANDFDFSLISILVPLPAMERPWGSGCFECFVLLVVRCGVRGEFSNTLSVDSRLLHRRQ